MRFNLPSFLFLLNLVFISSPLVSGENDPLPPYKTRLEVMLNDVWTPVDEAKPWKLSPIIYTSIVEYEDMENVNDIFTDEQFVGLAKQAWDEMLQMHADWSRWPDCKNAKARRYVKDTARPNMMAAIGIGNTIYFASSNKGEGTNVIFKHEDSILSQALIHCQAQTYQVDASRVAETSEEEIGNYHRSGGSCAEIMASSLVLKDTGELPPRGSRVVAWGQRGSHRIEAHLYDPCLREPENIGNEQVGCNEFMPELGLRPLKEGQNLQPRQVDREPRRTRNLDLAEVWEITYLGDPGEGPA
ncbi:hypothetical protein BS50DRAFT_679243 [Corynespora cassiicola Philippines]|uniref:Uncharacterized protein n=1 Tax=Corynespora cassiicola Philippines TaxID=1448308 RepID=A0A2T2NFD0_CORCC|nr:hypothetical protein BS50DRAFT_679243 [Corynespora cassiicola Philippines]